MATYGDDLQSFLSWLGYEAAQPSKGGSYGASAPGVANFQPGTTTDPTLENQILAAAGRNWQQNNPHGLLDLLPFVGLLDAQDLPSIMQQSAKAKDAAAAKSAGKGQAAAPGGVATQATVSANAKIPMPWDVKYNVVSGNDYGQGGMTGRSAGYGSVHLGVDYGTPKGTQISAPFAGHVRVYKNIKDYGNLVELVMANGWKLRFGHVADGVVVDGTDVKAGDPIAVSGGSGNAQGDAVTLVELRDANGHYQNPHSILDPVFQGTTTPELTALLQQSAPAKYWTPDGQLIQAGTKLDQMYQMVNTIWKKEFGTNAPAYAARALEAQGVQNMEQVQAMLNNMPSDIPGMNIGQRQALRASANGEAMKVFNRPVPDSLLKELAAQGRTDPVSVSEYFHSHPASDMPAEDYASVFDVASKWSATWGDTPTPDQVFNLWTQAGGSPAVTTPAGASVGAPGIPVSSSP